MATLETRQVEGPPDRVRAHIEAYRGISRAEARARFLAGRPDVAAGEAPVYIYGGQALNAAELARKDLAQHLAANAGDVHYTYSPHYLSGAVALETPEEATRREAAASQALQLTQHGFEPQPRSRAADLVHPLKPHPSRVAELAEPFVDPVPLFLQTRDTGGDPNKPPFHVDGEAVLDETPLVASVHYAGDVRENELDEALQREKAEWEAKLVVDDPVFRMGTPDKVPLDGETPGEFRTRKIEARLARSAEPPSLASGHVYVAPPLATTPLRPNLRRMGDEEFDIFTRPPRDVIAKPHIVPLSDAERAAWYEPS